MKDIQKTKAEHQILIPRVGIQDFKLPITILEKTGSTQNSVADISIFAELNKEEKGTHMSRLIIGAQKFISNKLSRDTLSDLATYIANKLDTKTVELNYKFPYFVVKTSPLSKEMNMTNVDVEFNYIKNINNNQFKITVSTIGTALCPCSKEISENGAHNQRSKISISVYCDNNEFVWIEDLIEVSNLSCSCQTYSVLKRLDEKFVTEEAYAHPKFVEDIVRDIYTRLNVLNKFQITVINYESIHQHNAYAYVEKGF